MPIDPPEVEMPEGEFLRTADLKNQVCLVIPREVREEPGVKPGRDGVIKPWKFVACDVAIVDRAGIVNIGTDVRVSWAQPYLALEQALAENPGQVVMGKFATEEGSNSIRLIALSGKAKEVAQSCERAFLDQLSDDGKDDAPFDDDLSEPF